MAVNATWLQAETMESNGGMGADTSVPYSEGDAHGCDSGRERQGLWVFGKPGTVSVPVSRLPRQERTAFKSEAKVDKASNAS